MYNIDNETKGKPILHVEAKKEKAYPGDMYL